MKKDLEGVIDDGGVTTQIRCLTRSAVLAKAVDTGCVYVYSRLNGALLVYEAFFYNVFAKTV